MVISEFGGSVLAGNHGDQNTLWIEENQEGFVYQPVENAGGDREFKRNDTVDISGLLNLPEGNIPSSRISGIEKV